MITPLNEMTIKQENVYRKNKLWCHLHCHDLSQFDDIYLKYFERIKKYFNIIITFNVGNYNFCKENLVLLQCTNRGYDIGPKFIAINYLNFKTIEFTFIFMLHSKSNTEKRKIYFDPFFQNLNEIVLSLNDDIGVVVPAKMILQVYRPLYRCPKRANTRWIYNKYHTDNLITIMDLKPNNCIFPEGNVYILHNQVANYLYDNRFDLYAKLNTKTSFDYNWFVHHYRLHLSYEDALKVYTKKKMYGNNMSVPTNEKQLADCMLEHAFERIIFCVCKKLNKNILKI